MTRREKSIKRIRRDKERWLPPLHVPGLAIFRCRNCDCVLTPPLKLIEYASALGLESDKPLLPMGHFWQVAPGREFAGQFAVNVNDVRDLQYHADLTRRDGCCGPSGHAGCNRICACGNEIGTEQSDCSFPHAVYLEPNQVRLLDADAEKEPTGED
jgi:hypothetical protein